MWAFDIRSSLICFLRGPEDDLIKVETCRPDNILFLLYINKVLLTDTLYLECGQLSQTVVYPIN